MRSSYSLILSICAAVFAFNSVYAQPRSAANEECRQAQVLSIQGRWVVGSSAKARLLSKADCLVAGEIVTLAPDTQSGEITVIYHSGDLPPYTLKCGSRSDCNNGYQVQDVANRPTTSWWGSIMGILHRQKLRRVPGLVRGSLELQPGILCSEKGKIDVASLWHAESIRPSEFDRVVLTPLDAQVYVSANGTVDSGRSWSLDFPINDNKSIGEPALYQLDTVKANGEINGSTIVLVAPRPVCEPLKTSYQKVVNYTLTWSTETPADAVFSFRSAFLAGLAEKTPTADAAK